MPTIIMDPCNYTRTGLASYVIAKGIKNKNVNLINGIDKLQSSCEQINPGLVFINEDCFYNDPEASCHIKDTIVQNPETLFLIFMTLSNNHFEDYLYARKNLVISSKSIKTATLDSLLQNYFHQRLSTMPRQPVRMNICPLTLSQTESNMLKMWMSGDDTIQISDKMQIKAKTVSSHKGNIKRKIKTHNKQVIHHVVRLMDNLTNGIYVNVR